MKRTNYFGRFENKSADAEDRLTRAFHFPACPTGSGRLH